MKILSALVLAAIAGVTTLLSAEPIPAPETLPPGQVMNVIERSIPGAGNMSPAELKAASQKSCVVLRKLGPQITWVQSYVTGDKLYCVYLAPNEEMIQTHAKESGFAAHSVSRVAAIISPKTAN